MTRNKDARLLTVGGRPNMGPALHAMFLDEPEKCFWYTKKGQSPQEIALNGERWRKELRKEIRAFRGQVCVLSGEALTESLFLEKSIRALQEFLLPLFDEVRVIGYVRPPFQYKNSRYQETIKSSGCHFNPGKVGSNYRAKFEKYDRVFGQQNVHLIKFDPSVFPNRCAVADFCRQVGIDLHADLKIQRFNESLSQNACGILYAYRKFGPGYGIGNEARLENASLIRALRLMGGGKFKLSGSIIQPALDSERDDIEWMERRLGESLAEITTDDGSEIKCEEDLLKISMASCNEFIKCFEEMYEVSVPLFDPESDPVDPREVAGLVQSCREICRQLRRQRKEFKAGVPRWLRSKLCLRLQKLVVLISGNFGTYSTNK